MRKFYVKVYTHSDLQSFPLKKGEEKSNMFILLYSTHSHINSCALKYIIKTFYTNIEMNLNFYTL